MDKIDKNELIKLAVQTRKNAYAPNSKFKVGAALYAKSGKIYTGCNIENGFTGPSICAERVAVAKAISEGEKDFVAIAVVGGKDKERLHFVSPCGGCRQFLYRFCKPDFLIICGYESEKEQEKYKHKEYTLDELLPHKYEREE